MKKLILAAITLTSAVSVFAQGTVIFNNRTQGTTHVYAPLNAADTSRIVGPGVGDSVNTNYPPADYGSRAFIGASGLAGQYGASSTLAQLLGGPVGTAESSLLPAAGGAVSFRTGTAAGGVANSTATFANIAPDAASAVFEMVAWDNSSGLYQTWAQAQVAWNAGLIAGGTSPMFTLNNIGGVLNVPQTLYNTLNGSPGNGGLVSFNLHFVPEPTTTALLGLGAAAVLIFRRRK